MSFLTRTVPILRTAAHVRPSPRFFSTTVIYQKTITEQAKDGLKTVDRAVSDQLVKGFDKGEELKDKAAATIGVETEKAKGTASELAGEAKGKAAELEGKAKGKVEEAKAKM